MLNFETATLVGVFENQSPEWAEARKGVIGGSQIGTILGLNPYESPLTCFYKMTGRISDQVEPSLRMRMGTLFEAPMLQLFQEQHPNWVVHESATYRSVIYPFLSANPDGFYTDEFGEVHLIEVKTSRDFWSEIPPAYVAQVQHYLWMFGLRHAKVVALTAGDYNEFDVEFDPFMVDANLTAVLAFWDNVQKGVKPDFDGSSSTYETMRELNPTVSDNRVEVAEQLGIDLVNTACEIDALERKLSELKSRVLDQMGDAKTAFITVEDDEFVVATRHIRGEGKPYLIVKKGK